MAAGCAKRIDIGGFGAGPESDIYTILASKPRFSTGTP
jgi:hypothetical protein